nr:hypothetical protein [uncultured Campylobacter sp.]
MTITENNAKACISLQRCDLRVAPFHNSREGFVPETSRPELAKKNRCSCSALAALQKIKDWDAKADENYAKTHGGRKSPVKEQNKVWEAVINLNDRHTLKDVKKLTKKLEKITGYKAAQVAIHKDEGHLNDDGDFVRNIHAHVIFYARDVKTGLSLSTANYARKDLMRLMQDAVADELGMERGRPVEETGKKHLSPRAYKAQKRQEAAINANNKEWEQKLAEKEKAWQEKQAEWERKQAEREAKREEWEKKLPEIMEARRKNEQFLNGKVDWETLKTANRAFMAWHDISTDILGYPNPNGNLIIEQAKGSLASIFRLFGSVSQLAIFLLTRTEARELKLKNAMDVYKVSENLQRAVNLVANDTTNDHRKIAEKIQSVFTNLPHDKRAELIELAILHAPNDEIREDIKAVVEGRFSHIARTEAAQKRIENRDLRAELRIFAEEARKIKEELKALDEENRILNAAERAILKQKGANRTEYAEQEAENRERLDELKTLRQQVKDVKKDLEEARKQQEVDKNTLKEQAAQITKLTAQIAEITEANVKKQKELEAEKIDKPEPKIEPKIEQKQPEQKPKDAFDIIAELEDAEKAKPEPIREPEKIDKPEPKIEKPEPEPRAKKADDNLNIYGYSRTQIEPRRRLDEYEPRPRYTEPEKIEPISEEPIFRDPWKEIQEAMEKWTKTESEVEKKILSTAILQRLDSYEKSGWDIPIHRRMSLDAYRRDLARDPADAIHRERERELELEKKRQAERETSQKFEDVKKNVKQETDAKQTAIKKKRKDELEMGR